MRPAARAAITAGSIVLVAMIALGFRTLNALGVFTDVTPGFSGTCSAISGIAGPEDIAIDEKSGLVFVSALDRRAKARGKPSAQDGIYALPLNGAPHLLKLSGTPVDFHPQGISLVRGADGSLTLMAINHRSDGSNSVEIFDVKTQGSLRLSEVGNIESRELVSPNAIAALDRDRFYVTNDHTSTSDLGRALDDLLVLPRANVLYFDGTVFRIAAENLNFPGGAALSPDGNYLYVTESFNRRLATYERGALSGSLKSVGTLAIPSGLDNLRFDAAGNLWVGSHPKALAMAAFRADPSKPAPSEIFRVTLTDGIPQSASAVYTNLGGQIGGASVAAVTGHRLLIGSPLDDKILDCTMDH